LLGSFAGDTTRSVQTNRFFEVTEQEGLISHINGGASAIPTEINAIPERSVDRWL
jgi:hypothetical protein